MLDRVSVARIVLPGILICLIPIVSLSIRVHVEPHVAQSPPSPIVLLSIDKNDQESHDYDHHPVSPHLAISLGRAEFMTWRQWVSCSRC